MARWYVLIGPYDAKPATLETQLALREDGYEGVRVARLRDRTGPGVASAPTVPLSVVLDMGRTHYRLAAEERSKLTDALEKRLATAEERIILMGARMAQFEGDPAVGGTGIVERLAALESTLAHLETEHAALVERVGELERLPDASVVPDAVHEKGWQWRPVGDCAFAPPFGTIRTCIGCGCLVSGGPTRCVRCAEGVASPTATAEPTPEQIEAYLRGSADWSRDEGAREWTHVRGWHLLDPPGAADETVTFVAAAESVTPAEMRARILAASSVTAEDPDRLAKVAFAANGAVGWERMSHLHDHYRTIAVAVAEACNRERDALLARAEKAERELANIPAELSMLRGIDDRMMSMGRSYDWLREHAREIGDAIKPCGMPGTSLAAQVRSLVADWQKRGEELEALRADLAAMHSHVESAHRNGRNEERADVVAMLDEQEVYARKHERPSADAYLHARVRIANGEHVGAAKVTATTDATRPTATPSEAAMAAELRRDGWRHTERWGWVAPGDGNTTIWTTATAHAAMRAAKGAK